MVSFDTKEWLTLTIYTAISLQTFLFLEGLEGGVVALPAVVVLVGVSVLLLAATKQIFKKFLSKNPYFLK